MVYIVRDERKDGEGDIFEDRHVSMDSAVEQARRSWSYLTREEKKKRRISVVCIEDDGESYEFDAEGDEKMMEREKNMDELVREVAERVAKVLDENLLCVRRGQHRASVEGYVRAQIDAVNRWVDWDETWKDESDADEVADLIITDIEVFIKSGKDVLPQDDEYIIYHTDVRA